MGKVNEYTGGEPIKEAKEKTEKFACGGKAKKRKSGGTVSGGMPAPSLAKRARGGALSSASSLKGRPGGKYDGDPDKNND